MVQHKVRRAAQFAKFCDMCEALEEFDIDSNAFVDWLGPLFKHFVEEQGMPKKVVKVDLPTDRVQMLTRWKQISEQVAVLKNEENQLRQKLVSDNFSAEKLEGVETIDIGYGWRLKATKELNISATNENNQTVTLLQELNGIDPGVANGLVSWKPQVSTKMYRELLKLADANPPLKALMAAAITVKPGMPQLEMVPPKEEAPAVAEPVEIETGITFDDGSGIKF